MKAQAIVGTRVVLLGLFATAVAWNAQAADPPRVKWTLSQLDLGEQHSANILSVTALSDDDERSREFVLSPGGNHLIISSMYRHEKGLRRVEYEDLEGNWWLSYENQLTVIGDDFPGAGDVARIAALSKEGRLGSQLSVLTSDGLFAEHVSLPGADEASSTVEADMTEQLERQAHAVIQESGSLQISPSAAESIRFLLGLDEDITGLTPLKRKILGTVLAVSSGESGERSTSATSRWHQLPAAFVEVKGPNEAPGEEIQAMLRQFPERYRKDPFAGLESK